MNQSEQTLHQLIQTLPQQGTVEWIGLRPAKKQAMQVVESASAIRNKGLEGDHYSGSSGNRSVTLIQSEHLSAMASLLHLSEIRPEQLRRNIVVSGINLLALKNRRFRLGEAELEMSGQCHPCSRMEEVLGAGGYNAVRGHGGITARVLKSGRIGIGDRLEVIESHASVWPE
jgi:MOSC domain-containing protein YiiM